MVTFGTLEVGKIQLVESQKLFALCLRNIFMLVLGQTVRVGLKMVLYKEALVLEFVVMVILTMQHVVAQNPLEHVESNVTHHLLGLMVVLALHLAASSISLVVPLNLAPHTLAKRK
jgi:hypothetical protein